MAHGSAACSENGIDRQAQRASECFVEKYHSLARRASFCERDKVRADSQNGTPWIVDLSLFSGITHGCDAGRFRRRPGGTLERHRSRKAFIVDSNSSPNRRAASKNRAIVSRSLVTASSSLKAST